MIKIEIYLTERQKQHLKTCDSHYDACDTVTTIIERIKRKL
jgi:hypothetical protein